MYEHLNILKHKVIIQWLNISVPDKKENDWLKII